jgi:hypothetical protein
MGHRDQLSKEGTSVGQAFLLVPAMVAQEWKGRNVCRTADWRLSDRERPASTHILSFRRFCVASLPPEDREDELKRGNSLPLQGEGQDEVSPFLLLAISAVPCRSLRFSLSQFELGRSHLDDRRCPLPPRRGPSSRPHRSFSLRAVRLIEAVSVIVTYDSVHGASFILPEFDIHVIRAVNRKSLVGYLVELSLRRTIACAIV